ncbi:uncharacterized protein LOC117303069 isoform X2 [Asterias rubens]|nr:uncharacterized protein LOC117303069 isoform X2 [Asterias rubens]
MSSSSVSAAAIIIVVTVTVSLSPIVSSGNQLNEPQHNDYDRSCFVPPSQHDDSKPFMSVDISYPPMDPEMQDDFQDYKILAIPNGTCGLDVYYVNYHIFLAPEYKDVIQQTEQLLTQACLFSPETSWYIKVLTTGSPYGYYGNSVKLVPDKELRHLPPEWLQGLTIQMHIDQFPATSLTNRCNVPLLKRLPNEKYNLNITAQLNGCPSGRYGGTCNQTCSCVQGVECHSFNGICMCPPGLEGTRCEHTSPRLSVQQQHVYVPYGTSYNLTCIGDGMIPANYSWIKESTSTRLVTASREKTVPYKPSPVVFTSTLEVNSTTVNGGYLCEVYDGNGTEYRQYVNVTVIAVPDPFMRVPQNQTALIDRNVVFTCKTKKAAGTIKWVKGHNPPSSEIKDKVGHYGVRHLSDGVSELHIYGVQFSDEDVYRCYVGFTFKEPDLNYAEAKLIVQSDPQPKCSFQDVVNATSGQEVTLFCQMEKVKPAPSLTWAVEGRQITPQPTTVITLSDDQYSFDVNTTMTFDPAPEDDGRRVSVAMESPAWEGSRVMSTSLNVQYAPIVEINPDPISLASGQDAVISCLTKANPRPTSYDWILSRPDKTPQIDSSTGDTYHLINIDMTYDLASLTCRAGNEVGETNDTVRMKVTENGFTPAATTAFSVLGGMCLLVLIVSSVLAYCFRKEVILWWSAKTGKNKDNKDFDVFISYKSGTPDEEFVVQELIPRLEQDGYRVCVHFRFFLPGRSIIDNISDAVRRSRKTLLLLTPGFVESEWCRYEFQAALLQMLRRQMDIIPVIFEDLGNPANLSDDIQTVLRTLSYITWPGAVLDGRGPQREGDKDRFWKLLWESLPDNPLGLEEQLYDLDGMGEDKVDTEGNEDVKVEENAMLLIDVQA